ncbi:Reticulon protein [Fasciolopsis buskii]|uniref:Reticulon-like protein n=1 Tax=Fasciolopsis buskii TaxID=27845 RepID=A0A8E0S532_9TREM|nr:Reticulon protein [Fasciolopsis buski]
MSTSSLPGIGFGRTHPFVSPLVFTAPQAAACEKCPVKEEVRSLIYWRHPIRSAIVLVSLLVVEISFLCLSAISLLAYAGILLLIIINGLRLYYQHIAKTENKMFKQLLFTRDIFLLTNFGASVKFGIVLYLMTYVGARFNFLTICIIATLVAFIVPKFYECYQSEIDRGLELIRKKANVACTKIGDQLNKLPVFGTKKEKKN